MCIAYEKASSEIVNYLDSANVCLSDYIRLEHLIN